MKHIIAILAALLLALAGCGQAEREPGKQESSTPVQSREEAPSSESQPAAEKTLPVFQPPVLEDPPFVPEDGEGSPEQNEWYQKRYLEPIFQSGILGKTFDAANKTHLEENSSFCALLSAFGDLMGPEQMAACTAAYGSRIPREVVEDCLSFYFPVTAEELRQQLLAGAYLPEAGVYRWEGHGTGDETLAVTASRRAGDTLELDYVISFGSLSHTGTATIQERPEGWRYDANRFFRGTEQNDISGKGRVSEDGSTYSNDALGLTVSLTPSGTGCPWHFLPQAALDGGQGMMLDICYEESGWGLLARVMALTPEEYRQAKEGPLFNAQVTKENSQWVFVVSFPRDPYYNAGTQDEENYQAMVKEIVPRLEGGDGLVITDPQG